jgi:hypothetical protein
MLRNWEDWAMALPLAVAAVLAVAITEMRTPVPTALVVAEARATHDATAASTAMHDAARRIG